MAKTKAPKPLAEAPPDPESSEAEQSSSTEAEDETETTPKDKQTNDDDEQVEEEEQEASSSSTNASSDDEPLPKKPPQKTPPSSDSSSEEEDDGAADNKNLKKPIASPPPKPTTTTTTTKPRSTPKPTVAALTAEKRALESDEVSIKGMTTSSKKPRREKVEKEKTTEEGSKKQAVVPFQRLFSEEDEIAILKGMIEFKTKKGSDPMIDVVDFYGFMKNSLDVEVNRGQFVDKIRRLKKRFMNAVQKKKKLSSPHDVLTFDLSKKIWESAEGGNGVVGGEEKGSNGMIGGESNVGPKSSSKGRVIKSKSPGGGPATVAAAAEEKKGKEEKGGRVEEKSAGGEGEAEAEADGEIGEAAANESVRRKGLRLMGAKARAEISDMWEKVVVAQREVDSMRWDAQKEENKRILEAINSAGKVPGK